jgi:signal transduction histidine kinase
MTVEASTTPHPDAVTLLSDIAVAISESEDVDSLTSRCAANVAALFRARVAAIWLIDPSGSRLQLRASVGPAPGEALTCIGLEDSLIGRIASGRRPRIDDPISEEFGLHLEDWARSEGITAFAGSPLMLRGKLIGVVGIFARHRLNERTLTLLRSLAQAIAAGIERKQTEEENARLYEELQRTSESLQRANAVKSEFLGLISHELRSPISTVVGNGLLLLNRGHLLDEADKTQALQDIVTEADRLHRVIENLLLLVRVEAGQKLDVEPVELPAIIEDAVEGFYRRHTGREVKVFDAGDAPVALGEGTLITLIVDNLISNANKYSPEGAPIEVYLRRNEDDEPEIRVRDYGIGLEEVDVETLFVPFYRSSRAKGQAKGVGLGLAVCKRVVEAQDGRIWAESRPDGGSDFLFTLKPAASA